jgi:hypothetical protein
VIETSGLADPGPVLQTFATDRALGREFHRSSGPHRAPGGGGNKIADLGRLVRVLEVSLARHSDPAQPSDRAPPGFPVWIGATSHYLCSPRGSGSRRQRQPLLQGDGGENTGSSSLPPKQFPDSAGARAKAASVAQLTRLLSSQRTK